MMGFLGFTGIDVDFLGCFIRFYRIAFSANTSNYADTNYVDFGAMWQFEDNSTILPWLTGILVTFDWNKHFLELPQSYKHWFAGIDVEYRMVYIFYQIACSWCVNRFLHFHYTYIYIYLYGFGR